MSTYCGQDEARILTVQAEIRDTDGKGNESGEVEGAEAPHEGISFAFLRTVRGVVVVVVFESPDSRSDRTVMGDCRHREKLRVPKVSHRDLQPSGC